MVMLFETALEPYINLEIKFISHILQNTKTVNFSCSDNECFVFLGSTMLAS